VPKAKTPTAKHASAAEAARIGVTKPLVFAAMNSWWRISLVGARLVLKRSAMIRKKILPNSSKSEIRIGRAIPQ
jgi:hypothetical protein